MAYDPTDAVQARAFLERALAMNTVPTLSAAEVTLLMNHAVSATDTYTAAALNTAAATGWGWKAGLTSAQYDLSGQGGAKLTRSQWYDHCIDMSQRYAAGLLSVVGTPASGRGIGSIGISTPYTADRLAYLDALDAAT